MGMTLEEKADPSVCAYTPSKTQLSAVEEHGRRTASPERHGVSSRRLCQLLEALEAEERANVRTVYAVKDGHVLLDASRPGFDSHTFYLSHSMAKSVTGMLIGTLVDEGALSLSDTVASFFPEYTYKDRRFASMTVEHLLIMSSGVPFAEVGVVTEVDWGRAFFSSTLSFAPGKEFMYNSMNSYILGRIAEKVSGKDLFSLAKERLFEPLGIDNAFWERDAQGHAKGGFGLYLSAASWAKLGSLYVSGGVYNGRRLLSESWIEQSSAAHMQTPASLGDFDYGYHVWVNRMGGEVLFNGMLGQNVWIRPSTGTVAVILSGNSELFQQSPALSLLRTYLFDLPEGERASLSERRRLRRKQKEFFKNRTPVTPKPPVRGLWAAVTGKGRHPFDAAWEPMLGTYCLQENNAALLPMFVRLMQNNYETDGIRTLTFLREDEELYMELLIGASTYRLPVGLYDYRTCTLSVGGESYIVRTRAQAVTDGEGACSYTIECVFPELPNTRIIQLYPSEQGRLRVVLRELPDQRLLESFRNSFLSPGAKGSMIFGLLQRYMGEGFLEEKATSVFEKSIMGGLASHPDTEAYLQELSVERTTRLNKYATIQGLIRRFVGSDDTPSESEDSPEQTQEKGGSWFDTVMSAFRFGRGRARRSTPDGAPTDIPVTDAPTDVSEVMPTEDVSDGPTAVPSDESISENKDQRI